MTVAPFSSFQPITKVTETNDGKALTLDFAPLLKELIRLGDSTALFECVKALKGSYAPQDFSDAEWTALEQIRHSHRNTAVGRLCDSLLRHRPHAYIADW